MAMRWNISCVLFLALPFFSECSGAPEISEQSKAFDTSIIDIDAPPLTFSGRINSELHEKIQNHTGERKLIIMSGGGSVEHSLDAAEILDDQNWSIVVFGHCLSACADIILLGSDEIKFIGNPIIGFHGDSLMKNYIYRTNSSDSNSMCFLTHQHREDALIAKRGINRQFWKEQYVRLAPFGSKMLPGTQECERISYRLTNKFWYPDSRQLQELYGLRFDGSGVAADFPMRYQEYFASLHQEGSKIRIADEVYHVSSNSLIRIKM